MRRWSHLHSLAAGGIGALAVAETHVWVLLVAVFVAGIMVGRFWGLVHWAGEALRFRVMHARRERIPVRPEPVYYGRDEIPY